MSILRIARIVFERGYAMPLVQVDAKARRRSRLRTAADGVATR
jgi:hypothetical protein